MSIVNCELSIVNAEEGMKMGSWRGKEVGLTRRMGLLLVAAMAARASSRTDWPIWKICSYCSRDSR